MTIFIAILGLALLILIHEAGHFFASLAVGLRPRKFYVGFPPAVVRTRRKGIEYGIGAIPLGGFVSIPGMHRPIPHDAERRFSRAVSEAPELTGALDRVKSSLEGDALDAALATIDDFEQGMGEQKLSPEALASAEKGITELRGGLGPDAYWKAPTWKRLVAIAAGPAANIALAVVLLTVVFMTGPVKPSGTVASVIAGSPAAAAGLRPRDRVIAIDGVSVSGDEIGDRIAGSEGRPLVLTVVRDGRRVILPPAAPELTDTGYRLGIVRKGVPLAPVDAFTRSLRWTGTITREIGIAVGRLARGEGRENVASPIGIVRGSADAVDQGAANYLLVLAFISLSLALLNLVPLLPLDGGHILFTLIEGARGRFVKREVYERVSVVGLALVLLLLFVGLSNDIGALS